MTGAVTGFTLNPAGDTIAEKDPDNNITAFQLDKNANTVATVDPFEGQTGGPNAEDRVLHERFCGRLRSRLAICPLLPSRPGILVGLIPFFTQGGPGPESSPLLLASFRFGFPPNTVTC